MELRLFPKKRRIPEKKPKTFVLYPFELWEKMKGTFEEKEEESLELIKNHLKAFKKPFIASSHGKDSVVMIHLVKRAAVEVGVEMPEVWLNHTLNVYKEESAYWDEINKFLGIEDRFRIFYPPQNQTVWSIAKKVGHLPNFRSTSRGETGRHWKETNIPECCDILKKKSVNSFLKALAEKERFDLNFVGTRAQESQMRSLGVLQRCRSYLQKTRRPYPIHVITPLSFWKGVDILEYFARYEIPKNPTYDIHNLERMGCASCPAHKFWEERLARDPTDEGFGMLKMNLKILAETDPLRLEGSLEALDKAVRSSKNLNDAHRTRVLALVQSYDHRNLMTDYF